MSRREGMRRFVGAAVVFLASAVLVLALLAERLATRRIFSDGARQYSAGDWDGAMRYVWTPDGPVSSLVVQGESIRSPAFAPGTLDLYFARKGPQGDWDLWRAARRGSGFAEPEPLFELNSSLDDLDPVIIDGGRALLFATNRPGGAGGFDIYRAEVSGSSFTEPVAITGPVNTESDERRPTVDLLGRRLVFASNRIAEDSDDSGLFECRFEGGVASDPLPIEGLDLDPELEALSPALSADGRVLWFSAGSNARGRDYDLFRTMDRGEKWSPAVRVDSLSTSDDEVDPCLTPEGTRVLWARRAGDGGILDFHLAAAHRREVWALDVDGGSFWQDLLYVLAAALIVLLLTYLYLRWRRLHPFIKFIILSIIVHLLILLLVKRLPGGGAIEDGSGGSVFSVTLLDSEASDGGASARSEAQGDRVEVAPLSPSAQLDGGERATATAAAPSAAEASTSPGQRQAVTEDMSAGADAPSASSVAVDAARHTEATAATDGKAAKNGADQAADAAIADAGATDTEARSTDAQATTSRGEVSASAAPASSAPSTFASKADRRTDLRDAGAAPSAPSRDVAVAARTSRDTTPLDAADANDAGKDGSDPQVTAGVATASATADSGRASATPVVAARGEVLPGRESGELLVAAAEVGGKPRGVLVEKAPNDQQMTGGGEERATAERAPTSKDATAKTSSGSRSAKSGRDLEPASSANGAVALEVASRTSEVRSGRGESSSERSHAAAVTDAAGSAGPTRRAALADRANSAEATGPSPSRSRSAPMPHAGVAKAGGETEPSRDGVASTAARTLANASNVDGVRNVHHSDATKADDLGGAASSRDSVAEPSSTFSRRSFSGSPTASGRSEDAPLPVRTGHRTAPRPGRPAPAVAAVLDRRNGESDVIAAPVITRSDMGAPARAEAGTMAVDRSVAMAAARTPELVARDFTRRRPSPFASEIDDERAPPVIYSHRRGVAKIEALRAGGGSDETEAAVLKGLRYLAGRQQRSGAFGRIARHSKYGDTSVGKTGLAILAYLGSGYTHLAESEFKGVVARGLERLMSLQDSDTGHIGDGEAYSHAIATYALAEAYAITKDQRLAEPLRRAVARVVAAQMRSRDRKLDGGWGYYYRDLLRRFDEYPRMSVTVWQVMALESARIGGIDVPAPALERARSFVERSFDPALDAFRYNHDPVWLNQAFATLPGSTSAALFAMQILGVPDDDPKVASSIRYIMARRPGRTWTRPSDRDFAGNAVNNEYFIYYATLALFRLGGQNWLDWNRSMQEWLLPNQTEDGSWRLISPYADYADDRNDDRCYTTAIAVLTLEVYYRYFTPLLSSVADKPVTHVPAAVHAGLRVDAVREGTNASRAGIRVGDLILEVGGETVATIEALQAKVDAMTRRSVTEIRVRRNDGDVTLRLEGRLTGVGVAEDP